MTYSAASFSIISFSRTKDILNLYTTGIVDIEIFDWSQT